MCFIKFEKEEIMRLIGVALFLVLLGYCAVAQAAAASYTYDALGRLTLITYDNGTTIAYVYDTAGNITGRTVTCGSGGC